MNNDRLRELAGIEESKSTKTINEGKNYPTQQDAEYLLDLVKKTEGLSIGGLSSSMKKLHQKVTTIHQKQWSVVFGDKSPWRIEINGKKEKLSGIKTKQKV